MINHGTYEEYQREERQARLDIILKSVRQQQKKIENFIKPSVALLRVEYKISYRIAKSLKVIQMGSLLRNVNEIMPEKNKLIQSISLSRRTITRNIEEISDSINCTLMRILMTFDCYSISLDESTDCSDTAQLAIFIRCIDNNFTITEEFLGMCSIKDTTTGNDLFNELKSIMKKYDLNYDKLVGIVTDGAPSMIGKNKGLVSLIKNDIDCQIINNNMKPLLTFYCAIHQQNLCTKSIKFENVMNVVIPTINFIRSRSLKHRQFKELLEELEAEHKDIIYYTEVRWLSKGYMLRRFYELRNEIAIFMEINGKPVQELVNENWVSDLAFLVDFTSHFNDLNLKLQGENQFIHDYYSQIMSFELKLRLWEAQLLANNFVFFPMLAKHEKTEHCYSTQISDLRIEFESRFEDFRKHEKIIKLFANRLKPTSNFKENIL